MSPPQGKAAKDDGDDGDTEFFGGEEIIASLSLPLVVARSHHVGPAAVHESPKLSDRPTITRINSARFGDTSIVKLHFSET